jgi:hypothetical protein
MLIGIIPAVSCRDQAPVSRFLEDRLRSSRMQIVRNPSCTAARACPAGSFLLEEWLTLEHGIAKIEVGRHSKRDAKEAR